MFASVITALLALASTVVLLTASAWLITTAATRPPLSELALGITAVRAAGIGRAVFRYLERLATHSAALADLNRIRVRLYQAALSTVRIQSGDALHDLTVRAELLKDFLPRVVIPIVGAVILNVVVTAIVAQSIGATALLIPIALLSTAIIARVVKEKIINDGDYRQTLLDFNDGRDEIAIADSFDRIRPILDRQADQLSDNRNNIINTDSLCAIINAAALCVVLYELSARLDMISLAVHLFLLLINVETVSTVPAAIRTADKIKFVDEIKKETPIPPSTTDKILEIDHIRFGYDGRTVLDGFSLDVLRAERIAIVGESGVGKTTLLYLIMGLLTPESGSIKIGGSIAAATNADYIFSRSIRENFLILHPSITEEKIVESLHIAQLDDVDLDADIGLDGARLSGGQRCRLQTALAVASDADILILDEPTAGLDRATADKLIENLLRLPQTLIVITHDPIVAAQFNSISNVRNHG